VRIRALLIAVIALVLVGSASAAHPKPKLVRVVRHAGAVTATLTYLQRGDYDSTHVTLRVRRRGTLVLSRKICPLVPFGFAHCEWMAGPSGPSLSVARVGPGGRPAFLVNAWNGGAHCCTDTFIAIPGRTVAWLTREWSGRKGDGGARVERRNGHHVFVTHDGRFLGAFSWPAGAAAPIRVFAIRRSGSFANVTKHFPGLIRAEVRRFTTPFGHRVTARTLLRRYGSGVFAAWCADEYLLGHGARCSRVLAWAVKRHWPKRIGAEVPNRAFARGLNRDLKQWGYKR
jgi:hypothetical protein